MNNRIHLELDADPGLLRAVADYLDQHAPTPAAPAADGLTAEQAMLARLTAWGTNGPNVQAMHDGLAGTLGLTPIAPRVLKPGGKPQAYLRYQDPRDRRQQAVMNTVSVLITRGRDKVAAMPGARVTRDGVYFRIATDAEVATALAAVKASLG